MSDPTGPSRDWAIIRREVSRFEEALRLGNRPTIDDYVAAATLSLTCADSLSQLTVDLVFADFEFRLKAGEPVRVEQYLTRYRDILSDPVENLVDLIVTEWSIRTRLAKSPPPDSEFQSRFPREYAAFVEARKDRSVAPANGRRNGINPAFNSEGVAPPRPLPTKFGKFELQAVIGEGSFGIVYRAWDSYTRQHVALKIARTGALASTEGARTFLREARVASQLKHPNIVRVLDADMEGTEKTPYLVCDLIEGRTLAEAILQGPIPFATAAQLMATIADALSYAHEHANHVIHRDLKPSNILLDKEDRPHLTDFGLAQRDGTDTSAVFIPKGSRFGTVAYMSPEQARGNDVLDPSSDIFSAGIIFYEILTGELPFRGREPMILAQITEDDPVPPRRLNDAIPPELEAICIKALKKLPADRYASAAKLRDELLAYLDGVPMPGTKAESNIPLRRAWAAARARPLRSIALAYCIFSGVVGVPVLAYSLWNQPTTTTKTENKTGSKEPENASEILRGSIESNH